MAKTRKLSIAIRRGLERGAHVAEQEIAAHRPTKIDLQIAESLLDGCVTNREIAERIGCQESTLSAAWANPVRAAWLSHRLAQHFINRLALIDATLFKKAMNGDMRAIEMYYKRANILGGQQIDVRHSHLHAYLDVDGMTTEDLDKAIEEKLRRQVIDVEARPVEGPPEGGEGAAPADAGDEGVPAARGTVSGVQTPPKDAAVPRESKEAPPGAGGEPVGEDFWREA